MRQRIVEQVREHFLDQRRVAEDRRAFDRSDEAESNPRLSAGRMPVLDQLLQQAHELNRLEILDFQRRLKVNQLRGERPCPPRLPVERRQMVAGVFGIQGEV